MDEELQRIDEEIRKTTEKRMKLQERKRKRIREIELRRTKDREAWMKKLMAGLDNVLMRRFGEGYWYNISHQQIYDLLSEDEAERRADLGEPPDEVVEKTADEYEEETYEYQS